MPAMAIAPAVPALASRWFRRTASRHCAPCAFNWLTLTASVPATPGATLDTVVPFGACPLPSTIWLWFTLPSTLVT
ncbi:hypothetical protein D9M68_918830 [compost metagenome]